MARRSFGRPSEIKPEGDRPDLETVLSHYGVALTYKTRQMVRCPIHGDYKTPSLSVDTDKGLWNCHSCGIGGDSWELIKQKEGVDFDGARSFAANLGWTTGSAGEGDRVLRGRTDSGRRSMAPRSGSDRGDRSYAPAWRRR